MYEYWDAGKYARGECFIYRTICYIKNYILLFFYFCFNVFCLVISQVIRVN